MTAVIERTPVVAGDTTGVLKRELVRSEDRLAAARKYYNDSVTVARTRSSTFPHVLLRPIVFRDGMPELMNE